MLNREAAVRITQTGLMITRELSTSFDYMYDYKHEGKVTEEQTAAHLRKVQTVLECLYEEIMEPIFADYPDLQPKRSCCGPSDSCNAQETKPDE